MLEYLFLKLYPRSDINKDDPKMAQLTAIKGRKIPSALYKTGENLSNNISTN